MGDGFVLLNIVVWGGAGLALLGGGWFACFAINWPRVATFLSSFIVGGILGLSGVGLLAPTYGSSLASLLIGGLFTALAMQGCAKTNKPIVGAAAGIVLSCVLIAWIGGTLVVVAILFPVATIGGAWATWKYPVIGGIVATSFLGAHAEVFGLGVLIELLGWEMNWRYHVYGNTRYLYQAGAIVLWMVGIRLQRRHVRHLRLVHATAKGITPQTT